MKRFFLLFVLLTPSFAFAASPSQNAEAIRSQLLQAQFELSNPAEARALLEDAQAAYRNLRLEIHAPELVPAASRVLEDAEQALRSGDAVALARARATLWTLLLEASYQVVESALSRGDGETARTWLALREFRHATRFSRPNTDATLALKGVREGTVTPEKALAAVRADLLDTYQARLNEALSDVAAAEKEGFATRRAEAAALAGGYFAILEGAYLEQRGEGALIQTRRAFATLQKTKTVMPALAEVENRLQGFRAAPLSPEEQVRRAGQMLRFLSLVPVEYGRGVRNGQVVVDLEIREAISFRDGAAAAFADVQNLLEVRDAVKTEAIAQSFAALEEDLSNASRKTAVADPADLRAEVETLVSTLKAVMPKAWQKGDSSADFDVIREALTQMEQAVAAGQYDLAASARLEAYAILESGPEARLTAFAPQFVPPIEDLFWYGQGEHKGLAYLLARKAPLAAIEASRAALSAKLDEAEAAFGGPKAPTSVATNAAIIVFREGLEAVVILASLMASLKGGEMRRFRRPMWVGAWAALLASVVTWFVLRGALLSFARFGEKLEAVVSLVAIGVLILITNWFFHDTYWTGWMASFHKKKGRLLKVGVGAWLGLAALGFTSIYREGFETVFFLQALVLESDSLTVLAGTVTGLAAAFLIGFIIFAVQTKLPYKKMFVVTAAMIGAVLLIMVGNTAHTLQVVGWLSVHPLRFVELPFWAGMWFGLYATWEGLLLQAVAAVFVLGSHVLAERLKRRARHVRQASMA